MCNLDSRTHIIYTSSKMIIVRSNIFLIQPEKIANDIRIWFCNCGNSLHQFVLQKYTPIDYDHVFYILIFLLPRNSYNN